MSLTPEAVIQAYFDAWDAHDPQAINALYAEDGTYRDSATDGALTGSAIGDYAAGLFAVFPDLKLDLISQHTTRTGEIAVPWLLHGTQRGAFGDIAPTGRTIVLRGCDYITVVGDKLQTVYGLFNASELVEQLT